jgi:hypothetical protein
MRYFRIDYKDWYLGDKLCGGYFGTADQVDILGYMISWIFEDSWAGYFVTDIHVNI